MIFMNSIIAYIHYALPIILESLEFDLQAYWIDKQILLTQFHHRIYSRNFEEIKNKLVVRQWTAINNSLITTLTRFSIENRAIFDESRMTRKWQKEKRERRKSAVDGNVNNKIIYDRYTMIVINCISAGRQNVPLCEELRFRWPSPRCASPTSIYFTMGTRYMASIIYLFSNMPASINLHILI